MYKKCFKYITFIFLLNFLSILNAQADLICQYEYNYKEKNKLIVSIDTTELSYVSIKSSDETALIKYGEKNSLYYNNGELISIVKVDKGLKEKVSKFKNCSDSIGFVENIDTGMLSIKDKCTGFEGDPGKCTMLSGKAITTGDTQIEEKNEKTTIKFTTSDELSGVLGVNENGNYYLKIDGVANDYSFPPEDAFTFYYQNKNYRIDPDTKDDIFKSKNESVYLYALNAGMNGTSLLLSLNAVKEGYPTPSNPGSITYDPVIDDEKANLDTTSFKGICSDKNVRKVFQLMGYALFIVKIAVPLCLLIFGIVNLVKVIVSGDQESLFKSVKNLMFKALAAIVIFILPTIVYYIINLVNGSNDNSANYGYCKTCIFDPKKC